MIDSKNLLTTLVGVWQLLRSGDVYRNATRVHTLSAMLVMREFYRDRFYDELLKEARHDDEQRCQQLFREFHVEHHSFDDESPQLVDTTPALLRYLAETIDMILESSSVSAAEFFSEFLRAAARDLGTSTARYDDGFEDYVLRTLKITADDKVLYSFGSSQMLAKAVQRAADHAAVSPASPAEGMQVVSVEPRHVLQAINRDHARLAGMAPTNLTTVDEVSSAPELGADVLICDATGIDDVWRDVVAAGTELSSTAAAQHALAMLQQLSPGGRAMILLPCAFSYRPEEPEHIALRDYLLDNGYLRAVVSDLPREEAGTSTTPMAAFWENTSRGKRDTYLYSVNEYRSRSDFPSGNLNRDAFDDLQYMWNKKGRSRYAVSMPRRFFEGRQRAFEPFLYVGRYSNDSQRSVPFITPSWDNFRADVSSHVAEIMRRAEGFADTDTIKIVETTVPLREVATLREPEELTLPKPIITNVPVQGSESQTPHMVDPKFFAIGVDGDIAVSLDEDEIFEVEEIDTLKFCSGYKYRVLRPRNSSDSDLLAKALRSEEVAAQVDKILDRDRSQLFDTDVLMSLEVPWFKKESICDLRESRRQLQRFSHAVKDLQSRCDMIARELDNSQPATKGKPKKKKHR